MNHAAIDLGGKESQICIRQPDGTIIEERKVPTRKLTELVATWAPSRVVMETSAEAFRIADAAIAAGHQVRVVPGTLVRLLDVGERGVKNDQRDAQQLSKASWQTDVPSVHIPSQPARELKSICGARDVLVGTRTKLINNVRGWLRTQLWKLRNGTTATFADRVRGHAASLDEVLPEHIERQLRMLAVVVEEVKAADKQLQKLASEHQVCRRLMTVPGHRAGDGTALCRGHRRAWSVCIGAPGPIVSGPDAGRALELGARAAHRDHQGGADGAAPHVDPGRLGGDVPCADLTSDDRLGAAARRAPWPTGRRGGARPQARRDLVRDVAGRNHLPIQAERGGDDAQLATKSGYAANSANPGDGCPKAASAITWFRGRRLPTTIWAVRMRRRLRTHSCAPSANSR